MIFSQTSKLPTVSQTKLQGSSPQFLGAYLFRVHTLIPQSNDCRIESAAVSRQLDDTNIFDLKKIEAITMIEEHLAWRNSWSDNFVSWTCSLLFALQYAIYRYYVDFGEHNFEDIQISVVNTAGIARGSFISARSLMLAYGIDGIGRMELSPNDLQDEFLSQGTIDVIGVSITTNLAILLESGLYDLIPELDLESEKKFLWRRVKQLRAQFSQHPKVASDGEMIQLRQLITKTFGGTWEIPMTAYFLSLRSSYDHVDLLCSELQRGFSGPAIHQAAKWTNEKMSKLSNIDIPEVQQYLKIMSKSYQTQTRPDIESTTEIPLVMLPQIIFNNTDFSYSRRSKFDDLRVTCLPVSEPLEGSLLGYGIA
ncbi:hypothetical protein PVAG01_09516 [Phlyctema vagabunda]|uniref:DUF7587 domain-containing protein n=1 Tax=Phlyctema vagabunda TaxID=108571 RepID=A0ABR4P7N7_9HELO